MVKIFTCMGRDVVTYIVKPRTTTSMSPSSVVDTVERTTTPGRGATGAATANPLPASMATVIITAYLTAFSFTLQSYKKSVNRRLYRPIKISVRHQWCMEGCQISGAVGGVTIPRLIAAKLKAGAAQLLGCVAPVYGNKVAACLAAARMSVQFKDYRPSCAKSAYHFEGVHDAVGCRGADYGHALGQCHGGYAAVCGNGAACGVDNYDVGGC